MSNITRTSQIRHNEALRDNALRSVFKLEEIKAKAVLTAECLSSPQIKAAFGERLREIDTQLDNAWQRYNQANIILFTLNI